MARWWKEPYDPQKHGNAMPDIIGERYPSDGGHRADGGLLPEHVIFVRVARFTFLFLSLEQLRACLAYFERKLHPSSRLPIGGADHWEVQRWFDRLPRGLMNEHKRPKVVNALRTALEEYERDSDYRPVRF